MDNLFSFGAHGGHRAWTEGDDVVHIEWIGDVMGDDIRSGARAFELVPNREKGFYLVIHTARQGRFSSEAREAIRSDPRSAWAREVIIVGAGFHIRVLMGMVTKALNALGVSKAKQTFLDDSDDVSAHIEKARKAWREKSAVT